MGGFFFLGVMDGIALACLIKSAIDYRRRKPDDKA
jgi:hypothetical protein